MGTTVQDPGEEQETQEEEVPGEGLKNSRDLIPIFYTVSETEGNDARATYEHMANLIK